MKKFSEKKEPPPKPVLKVAMNLYVKEISKQRGLTVLREMGYEASEFFEKMLEKIWEERRRIPHRKRGDHLQLTIYDQITAPEEKPPTKAGK